VNVLRSLARYVALALGEEYEVRLGRDEAAGLERPAARMVPATPVTSTPHGARHAVRRRTFAITALPVPGINAESSLMEALRIEYLLSEALTGGIDQALFSTRSERRHPHRIPLFDYSGLGLYEPASEDRRAGVARVVEPPAIQSFPDPADDLLYTVTCTVRLEWTESVTRATDWRTVEETRLKNTEAA
jgi:hypothetical protein